MNLLFTDAVLTRSLILFLLLGSVAGLFAGSALLLRPDWLLRASNFANRWISTRRLARPLAQSYSLDNWLYRYNRVSGTVLFAGSVYILFFFTAVFDKQSMLSNVFKFADIPVAVRAGLTDALVLSGISGAVFVAIVSLFLLFRPSMLRELELRANHKTSIRQALKPLESPRAGLDAYVFQNVRLMGILILAGSLYTLVILVSNLHGI